MYDGDFLYRFRTTDRLQHIEELSGIAVQVSLVNYRNELAQIGLGQL
jgi:hypothetical protein